MAGLLTEDMVKQAIPMVEAVHKKMLELGMLKRPDLHMVFLDPTVPYYGSMNIDAATFSSMQLVPKSIILCEHSFTPKSGWEKPFDEFARQKAFATWRTGMPTRVIRECAPHLLENGNTVHGGSVLDDGLIVAASGAQPWADQSLAGVGSAMVRFIANEKMQMEILQSGEDFI